MANLRVRSIAARRSTDADASVVCGPLELDPSDATRQTVLNPTVLIEVQRPSTESDDRGPKLDCYKLISSVQAVLLVAQDENRVDAMMQSVPESRHKVLLLRLFAFVLIIWV